MPLFLQPFARYATFSGRAHRAEYWGFYLTQVVVYILIAALAFTSGSIGRGLAILLVGCGLFALACFLPNLALTVRRLHDTDRSAFWLLLYVPGVVSALLVVSEAIVNQGVVPAYPLFSGLAGIANLVMLVLMGLPGTKGANRFGPDPKGNDESRIAHIFDMPEEDNDDEVLAPEPTVSKTTTRPVAQGFSAPPRPVFGKRGRLN